VKKKYFTIIEVFIVIIVISLIMGMAIVQMDAIIPSSRLKQQVRETSNTIELAFAQAAIEGRPLALHFKREERMLTLEYYFATEEQREFYLEQLESESDEDYSYTDEIEPLYWQNWDETINIEMLEVEVGEEEEPRDYIIFRPEGMSDGARIIWREESGLTQELLLWPLLGKIEILPLVESGYY
jgi:type II secretory pathway pseudopilin PulG